MSEGFRIVSQVRDIQPTIRAELADYSASGLALLMLDALSEPHEIVAGITQYVEKLRQDDCRLEEDDLCALAALLGDQYVAQFGWRWAEVVPVGNEQAAMFGVVSTDAALMITPFWWVHQVLQASQAANFLHNFARVAKGQLPEAEPGALVGFH